MIDKLMKMRQDSEDIPAFKKAAMKERMGEAYMEEVANSKLMVEGLSKDTPTFMLQNLFESYVGFKDVNHIE